MHCLTLMLLLVIPLQAGDPAPPQAATAELPAELPTIEVRTKSLQPVDGFLKVYLDDDAGTVLAELPESPADFLYVSGLSSGLGSNPVGLDRGQWGRTRLVRTRRAGRRMYFIEQNMSYRATADRAAEQRAVDESFADSVFWSTDILARTGGRVLIDLRTLLLRDAHNVAARLKSAGQGDYSFKDDLSFIELERCRAFPRNTELSALVTYGSGEPGSLMAATAADGRVFSLRLHHSFVKLPEPGYTPRRADPRVASITVAYADYSAPLDRPLESRLICRHRLQKANPKADISAPVQPIVYYLDPGTPQPVRDALLDGARWWNAAFEAAGYRDAFRVELLPDDADPMDVRFNVIQWVHRRTRGWSYGQSIVDPRTGEIIKGHVLLGSLRVRQDRLIVDGLTAASGVRPVAPVSACAAADSGPGLAIAAVAADANPVDVALARLRQLSAHEVGHTIGFAHNFAASTWGDRASVMDYPAPRVRLTDDGEIDLSDAYGTGVGEWDTFMVRYAYTEFPDAASEEAGLQALLDEARRRGLRYLSDADARPIGAANPVASLWDNGTDPVDELQHLMRVRRVALQKLGEDDLLPGQSLSDFEVVLVPIYLYHRYQVDAVARLIGGFDYEYAVAGQPARPVQPVPQAQQRRALRELLQTLEPAQLRVPSNILSRLNPKAWPTAADRERFPSRTAMIFDPDAAVQVAADLTLSRLLHPQRAARLEAYATDDWNLDVVLGELDRALMGGAGAAEDDQVRRIVQHSFVRSLVNLAGDSSTSHAVRATAAARLRRLAARFEADRRVRPNRGHAEELLSEIRRFLDRPYRPADPVPPLPAPPGSPIGSD